MMHLWHRLRAWLRYRQAVALAQQFTELMVRQAIAERELHSMVTPHLRTYYEPSPGAYLQINRVLVSKQSLIVYAVWNNCIYKTYELKAAAFAQET